MLIALLTCADRVKIGCLAQVVNVIGPIMTEPGGRAWRQSIFHPFAQASQLGRGTVLQSVLTAPTYNSRVREGASVLMVASILKENGLTIFAVNREPNGEALALSSALRGLGKAKSIRHTVLSHPDLKAVNTADAPQNVAPRSAIETPTIIDDGFTATLPPYSWNVIDIIL
jgi:alpha-N-arabinofuranosidase